MESPVYTERKKRWLRKNSNLLLFATRHPLDRIVSAFNFRYNSIFGGNQSMTRDSYGPNHVGAKFYIDCFPSPEEMAQKLDPRNGTLSDPAWCREYGTSTLQGRRRPKTLSHLFFNYGYYASVVWRNRSEHVAVIRTEAMWQDVANLEELLGGNPQRFRQSSFHYSHGSEAFHIQSGLSDEAAIGLCCVLQQDLQVYTDLIASAVNLRASDVRETLVALLRRCGVRDISGLSDNELVSWSWEEWSEKACKVAFW
jgi:hypothetical protein